MLFFPLDVSFFKITKWRSPDFTQLNEICHLFMDQNPTVGESTLAL